MYTISFFPPFSASAAAEFFNRHLNHMKTILLYSRCGWERKPLRVNFMIIFFGFKKMLQMEISRTSLQRQKVARFVGKLGSVLEYMAACTWLLLSQILIIRKLPNGKVLLIVRCLCNSTVISDLSSTHCCQFDG